MKNQAKILLFIIISLFLFKQDVFGFSLNVDPPTHKLSAAPGSSATSAVKAENRGENPIVVRVYAEDWGFIKNGSSKDFKPAGTLEHSCSNWTSVYPEEFTLEPGEKKEVQFTTILPEDATGGYQTVLFFETGLGSGADAEGVAVRFAGRLGVIVYIETDGRIIKDGSIFQLEGIPPTETSPLEINIGFENTGNTAMLSEGIINIIDDEGNIYANEPIKKINSLPGDKITRSITWPGELEAGEYDIVLTLEFDDGDIMVKESTLIVPGQ